MMTEAVSKRKPARLRASKACQRCSQRKIKCDGVEFGLPCSRCQSDKVDDCSFSDSRRGSYPRKKRLAQPQRNTPKKPQQNYNESIVERQFVSVSGADIFAGDDDGAELTGPSDRSFPATETVNSSCALPSMEDANASEIVDYCSSNSFSTPYPTNTTSSTLADQQAVMTNPVEEDTTAPKSLACMFEEFLSRQGNTNNRVAEKQGIVLLAESSPLTFALEEMQKGKVTSLHDGGTHLSDHPNNGEGLAGPRKTLHGPHISSQDIVYLESKGAFDFPQADILKALVESFLTRFYPLYSIVNKDEFESLYHQQRLPWILLHAVCFIGVTFCDQSVIHQSSSKQRSQVRQIFYDKAKLLFDIGYETNKIVLLQSVLMLSFWGPKMNSYWNPSSWVGFAVTIAASLGIHRAATLARMDIKDRSLLRRLWWIVVIRDASCATLLGRPFRIRMSQCDSNTLTLEDFDPELHTYPLHTNEVVPQLQALYQIHVSRLSLVLRQIIGSQSSGNHDPSKTSELHALLQNWRSELPEAVDWSRQPNRPNIFAISLKIVFHHHLILIYLRKPGNSIVDNDQFTTPSTASSQIVASAAQVISSSALTLMTKFSVSLMPHEVFPGFFIAGIFFYRQIQQREALVAQLGKSALDNCQMVLNEARENCDAALWMMRIFDFLLSSTSNPNGLEADSSESSSFSAPISTQNRQVGNGISSLADSHPHHSDLNLHSIDWDLPQHRNATGIADDFLFIPNLYAPMGDSEFDLPFYP